ncbi:MAG: hypothetical protein ACYDBQ_05185 [Thermoplasmatota archaeon]
MRPPRAWLETLKDPDIRRWYENVARRNPTTAEVYLRYLCRELAKHGLSPGDLLRMKSKEREDTVVDCIDALSKRGVAGSSIVNFRKAVRSFLSWHELDLKRHINIEGAYDRPRVRDYALPTQDQLRLVLNAGSSRARVAIAFMAFAGVRPQVLGNEAGDNGLRLENLRDLRVSDQEIAVEQVPMRVQIPAALSKNRRPYFTFLGPEGCDYLVAYLLERRHGGEELTPKSPVIATQQGGVGFLLRNNVSTQIRNPMRAVKIKEPPYIFRSYFDSRAMLAEGNGLLRDYRQFFMGHEGDIEHRYALHKKLPDDTIEQMRAGYAAALEYLETKLPGKMVDVGAQAARFILRSLGGLGEEEIESLDLEKRGNEEIVGLVRQAIGRTAEDSAAGHASVTAAMPVKALQQKVVSVGDLDTALAEGWLYKATLADGRVIIESTA